MSFACPCLDGGASRLITFLSCTGSGDEIETIDRIAQVLGHYGFEDVLFEFGRRIGEPEGHLDYRAFLWEVEVNCESIVPTQSLFGMIRPEVLPCGLAEPVHELKRRVITLAGALNPLEFGIGCRDVPRKP